MEMLEESLKAIWKYEKRMATLQIIKDANKKLIDAIYEFVITSLIESKEFEKK